MDKKIAGYDFVSSFMRDCGLTLRKPESTSIARLTAFNRVNVGMFYGMLKVVRMKCLFPPERIYNVDETGFSTVATRNPKVISPVGARRVIKISSAERGVTVTCVCAFNATGNYIPPFMIFPRKRMSPMFLKGAPPGAEGVASETGWMTGPNFVKYLQHFARHARPSLENPILLLMDNHASHVTLESIQFSRENGIIMLGFPPHTSHRLQPLDVGFYGPLKTTCSKACDDFLVSHPGNCITIREVAGIFGKAYLKASSAQTAVNDFKATGIEPFDSNIFRDEDFEPSLPTDRTQTAVNSQMTSPAIQVGLINQDSGPEVSLSVSESSADPPQQSQPLILQTRSMPAIATSLPSLALPHLPVTIKKTTRKPRKKLPSLLLSGTPVKEALEERKKEQEDKELKRQQTLKKKAEREEKQKTKPPKNPKLKRESKKSRKPRRQLQFFSSDESSQENIPYIDTDDDMDMGDWDDKYCIICKEFGKDELWYQCFKCFKWAHAECTGWDEEQASHRAYRCDFCI